MKLDFKRALDAIRRLGRPVENQGDDPVSLVLLLREPRFPTLDQLRSAGERAFGAHFNGGKESQHFVMQAALFTIMKVGPHTLSFLNYTKPYGANDFPPEFAMAFPEANQREAWRAHEAWTAVDYVKGGMDFKAEYSVLATLCAEIIDTNCLALYEPREQTLIPNDASLRQELSDNGVHGWRNIAVSPTIAEQSTHDMKSSSSRRSPRLGDETPFRVHHNFRE